MHSMFPYLPYAHLGTFGDANVNGVYIMVSYMRVY